MFIYKEDIISLQKMENDIYNRMGDVDKLTLELFLNKTHYTKCIQKVDPIRYEQQEEQFLKFQKHRNAILDITRKLLLSRNRSKLFSSSIHDSFEIYAKQIVRDLEIKAEINEVSDEDTDVIFSKCLDLITEEDNHSDSERGDGDNSEVSQPQPTHSFWSKDRVQKMNKK